MANKNKKYNQPENYKNSNQKKQIKNKKNLEIKNSKN